MILRLENVSRSFGALKVSDSVTFAVPRGEALGVIGPNGAGVPPFAAKTVCKTPLVGGQWRKKAGGGFELVIVENATAPEIPAAGKMEPLA